MFFTAILFTFPLLCLDIGWHVFKTCGLSSSPLLVSIIRSQTKRTDKLSLEIESVDSSVEKIAGITIKTDTAGAEAWTRRRKPLTQKLSYPFGLSEDT
ncbi:hypothetical protein H4582DRAFT_953829 [Lactarius indigo]|nr:hypothetical protein H4582DRAFT_953829 [Lactarius indigo]